MATFVSRRAAAMTGMALLIALLPLLALLSSSPTRAAPPNSRVLNYLYSIMGSRTVAGQHNREPNAEPAKWTNAIANTTGRYPGLWSGDFLFYQSEIDHRWTMINEAKRQWNAGAIVNIMWHACPPTQPQACGWEGGVMSHLSDSQWNELITPGTGLYNAWRARMDSIVPYLQDLKNNGVEVLWRPLHEMNQGAFWWGGRPGPNGTRRLFQITHDYLTGTKGLNNLIWVWDVQDLSWNFADYNPGSSYWDIAALDVYGGDGFTQQKYDAMLAVAGGKPIAIGETAKLPSPAVLAAQPRWVFFMAWAELVYSSNSEQEIRTIYADPRVLTRDELPGWQPPPTPNLALNKPASSSSNESASQTPNLAVDGNAGTRWSSLYSDPQWIRVDLGASYNISRVRLYWELAHARAYQIQLSGDGTNWSTIYSTSSGDGSLDDLAVSGSGRYIRVYGTTRATSYGYSLWELQVYGTAGSNPTATRTRTNTSGSNPTATRTRTNTTSGTPAWAPNTWYAVGATVSYGGRSYRCLQAHTSQVGWEPPNVPALWQAL